MSQSFFLRNINSDLSVGGALFNRKLLEDTATAASQVVNLSANQTLDAYAWTEPDIPSDAGGPGDYTVSVHVTSGATQIENSVRIARVNSSGTVQAESGFSTPDAGNAGVKVHEIPSVDLGTWAAGDRLRVQYRFVNTDTMMARSLTIELNTVETEVITPWEVGGAPQSEPVGAAIETEVAQPVTEGTVAVAEIQLSGFRIDLEYTTVADGVIPVGPASETETAQAVNFTTIVSIAVTEALESEAAESVAAQTSTTVAVVAASESENAEAVAIIAGAATVAVGAVTESEDARIVGASQAAAPQTRPVDFATEIEAAEPVAFASTVTQAIVFAVESEAGQLVASAQVATVPVVAGIETEAAEAVGVVAGATSISVTASTESEESRIVGASQAAAPQSRPVDFASETEAAQAVAFETTVTVAISGATESEQAQVVALTAVTSINVDAASESDLAGATGIALSLLHVVETEQARIVGTSQAAAPQSRPVDFAAEVEAALLIEAVEAQFAPVAAAIESETSEPIFFLRSLDFARPDFDLDRADWESAPIPGQDLFAQIDEETADDNDYIFVGVSP